MWGKVGRAGQVPVTEGQRKMAGCTAKGQISSRLAGAAPEGHERLFIFSIWGCEHFSPRKGFRPFVLLSLFSIQRKEMQNPS